MASRRSNPNDAIHVLQMRDEEWIELAKECQAEWDAKRAQKEAAKAL
jgi:hypothetical protein